MSQAPERYNSFTVAHVALGANLPLGEMAPARTVARAMVALDGEAGRVEAASRIYTTPCMPRGAGPDYANAVVRLATQFDGAALLDVLHRVEARFDRARERRWGARTLDLDLLDWGEAIHPDRATWSAWARLSTEEQRLWAPDRLILPHPRLQARGFVLVPLAEISPDWRHPALGETARYLRDALPAAEREGIRAHALAAQGETR